MINVQTCNFIVLILINVQICNFKLSVYHDDMTNSMSNIRCFDYKRKLLQVIIYTVIVGHVVDVDLSFSLSWVISL